MIAAEPVAAQGVPRAVVHPVAFRRDLGMAQLVVAVVRAAACRAVTFRGGELRVVVHRGHRASYQAAGHRACPVGASDVVAGLAEACLAVGEALLVLVRWGLRQQPPACLGEAAYR
jgi:hypothetical protein